MKLIFQIFSFFMVLCAWKSNEKLYNAVQRKLSPKVIVTKPHSNYQGKNYDPDYLKKVLGPKYNPSRDLDQPNIAWQGLKKYESKAVRKQYKSQFMDEDLKRQKFGENYDPSYQSRRTVSKPKSKIIMLNQVAATPKKGYQGKHFDPNYAKKKFGDNYDPDYLKKVLGDRYDPNYGKK